MKVKVKKSILKEAIEKHVSYILEKKSTPLMSATFKLLEMFESCNESQRKSLSEVFSLLEEELYLEKGELSSLIESLEEMKKDEGDIKSSKEDKDKNEPKKIVKESHDSEFDITLDSLFRKVDIEIESRRIDSIQPILYEIFARLTEEKKDFSYGKYKEKDFLMNRHEDERGVVTGNHGDFVRRESLNRLVQRFTSVIRKNFEKILKVSNEDQRIGLLKQVASNIITSASVNKYPSPKVDSENMNQNRDRTGENVANSFTNESKKKGK